MSLDVKKWLSSKIGGSEDMTTEHNSGGTGRTGAVGWLSGRALGLKLEGPEFESRRF